MREVRAAGCFALLLLSGCAENEGEETALGDDRVFVPEDLPNTEANGAEGGLTLVAFTLLERETGLELYAAVQNEGDVTLCEPGMTADFVDRRGTLAGSAGVALYSGRFFRIEDGSGAIVTCVPPGETALGGAVSLPDSIVVGELAEVRHSFPSFIVPNLVPVQGLTLGSVEIVASDGRSTYAGTLHNALELSVTNPRVLVFPLNRAGRPLGMASAEGAVTVAPGEDFRFETSAVDDAGTRHAAFPAASVVY